MSSLIEKGVSEANFCILANSILAACADPRVFLRTALYFSNSALTAIICFVNPITAATEKSAAIVPAAFWNNLSDLPTSLFTPFTPVSRDLIRFFAFATSACMSRMSFSAIDKILRL